MINYGDAFKYKLIYIMAIDDEEHSGLLKIGEATLASTLGPSQLSPNCDALNGAAHDRIKEYTKTALVAYQLLHTELAIRFSAMADETVMPSTFSDKDIHEVLDRSGYLCKKFPDTDRNSEWYAVDLNTARNAIKAYKERRNVLSPSEKTGSTANKGQKTVRQITLRQEQEEAVKKTLRAFKSYNTMLWDCKMRFGKTLTSYELIRRAGFQKTIVVTHRPVVEEGWQKDHDLIFGDDSEHLFVTKKVNNICYEYDAAIDSENERILKNYSQKGVSFTYFASMQDLRGSKRADGKFDKNNAVFDMDWDLIIYDEAHEGTQTDLGRTVQKLLEKPKNGKKPKVLSLSGTPYNILGQYEENIYTWDYVMEQRCKQKFARAHPDEYNPYADLPQMRIYTFDLQDSMPTAYRYETEDMAFNFREFFRTWTGDPKIDFRPVPAGASIGDFVHEADVRSFLDLITQESDDSYYPFSNQQFRNIFKHTFWMVPGVKEARALSKLLKQHPVFSNFAVANVAGEGDEEEAYDDALKKVQEAIVNHPYSITISCGRLTTGVTVPEWSAVMMLSGSSSTSASGYMQTIFRVQSVGSVEGKQKEAAYVFDFAPDRALKVISEAHSLSRKGKSGDIGFKDMLGEFLNFCPVISVSGTRMLEYDVPKMMRQIKKITVDKAIKSGFDDESIYNEGVGIVMDQADVNLFNRLASIIHGQSKAKSPTKVTINKQGMTDEEYAVAEKAKNKRKRDRTKEDLEALKKQQEAKKEQEKVIRLLRAVSIRLPMLIYGARVDLDKDIRITDFVTLVDDESWAEFLPQGITKDLFKQLLKYYDEDVVVGAGLRIRRLAKAADELPPTRRVQRIAEIFALFRNPDKETVLTPWRVVNMHMGDTIGGYSFYAENYPIDGILEKPRWIDNGNVTAKLFMNPNTQLLEMNSKSGLYPLYLTYSLYAKKLPGPEDQLPMEEIQSLWRETLDRNIYVLCKTEMARSITRRTLAGYQEDWTVHAIHLPKLLDCMEDKHRLARKLTNPAIWGKEGKPLKFDAIVGNPPYQSNTNGGTDTGRAAKQAAPVFNLFVEQAKMLTPRYISMIIPARWYNGGMGLANFRTSMMNDRHITQLYDFINSKDCFPTVDIGGGLCYFLWEEDREDDCAVTNILSDNRIGMIRSLNQFESFFVRSNEAIPLIEKIREKALFFVSDMVSPIDTFGIPSKARGHEKYSEGDILLIHSDGLNSTRKSYIKRSVVTKNVDLIDKYKVRISILVPQNGEVGVNPENGYRSISTPHVVYPGEVDSFSYLNIGFFDTENEAENFKNYMMCKLPRFMMRTTYSSAHISQANFVFVPRMDFSRSWNDAQLYEYFGLSDEEIRLIESTMRPMVEDE